MAVRVKFGTHRSDRSSDIGVLQQCVANSLTGGLLVPFYIWLCLKSGPVAYKHLIAGVGLGLVLALGLWLRLDRL